MSVDDSKLIRASRERRGRYSKRDIDNMQNWTKTWQISFNYDKCNVMHFGKEEKNTGAWGTTS